MKFRIVIPFGFFIVGCLTLLGTLLRLTVRDSLSYTATLFYSTPLPLLVLGAGVMFARQRSLKNRKLARIWAGCFLILFVWWINIDWRYHGQPQKTDNDIVVLLANIARNENIESLEKRTLEIQPDIICLVEAMALTAKQRLQWKNSFPGYRWSMVDGGTQLFVKGEIGSPWVKPHQDGSRLSRSVLEIGGNLIHCYTVDIVSTIRRPRKPPLDELVQFLNERNDENVLILGDFNTPSDSVHLETLRVNHENLFEVAGTGYAATWPFPVPVLALDQIWIGQSLEPVGCRVVSNFQSDHRMLIGRFRIREHNSE